MYPKLAGVTRSTPCDHNTSSGPAAKAPRTRMASSSPAASLAAATAASQRAWVDPVREWNTTRRWRRVSASTLGPGPGVASSATASMVGTAAAAGTAPWADGRRSAVRSSVGPWHHREMADVSPSTAGVGPMSRPGRHISSGMVLALVCVGQFMVVLDLSIVNVALPSMQRDLGFTTSGLQWVVNAYALTFGGFLLLGGRAADLFGRRAHLHARPVPVRRRQPGVRRGPEPVHARGGARPAGPGRGRACPRPP